MPGEREIILHEAFAGDGVVAAARVGEDPGAARFERLDQALRGFFEISRHNTAMERDMALALHLIAFETETRYREWERQGQAFRPGLMDHDLPRLARAVAAVLEGRWGPQAQ